MPAHLFQSFWFQPRLSPLEDLCIKSFLEHEHRFTLYSYNEIEKLPEGCVLEDARAILPEDAVFTYRSGPLAGSPAAFANLFRYKLLRDRGGWWVDLDTLCLTDDVRETEYVFVRIDDKSYANGIVKAPAGSAFASLAFELAEAQGREAEWLANGPAVATEVIAELGLETHTWETRDLLPLSWNEALAVLDPGRADEIEQRLRNSTFLHLWNQMFMVYNILKTARPPEGSLLARMYARFDVEFPAEPRYEWSDLSHQVALQNEHWKLHDEIARLRQELQGVTEEVERLRRRRLRLPQLGLRVGDGP